MSRNKGLTLLELIFSVVILGIITLAISTFFTESLKLSFNLDTKRRAYQKVFPATMKLERILVHANEILTAKDNEIVFIADLNTWDNFNENEDFDNDGEINKYDPDIDNDATEFTSSEEAWKTGYNLKDDDDDNDEKIDMRWKIYISTSSPYTLYYDYSYNEEDWGNHKEILISGLFSREIFSYFGSKEELLSTYGASIDSDGDGIVTEEEIDSAGNNNNQLDLEEERNYIVSIRINLATDINQDGEIDYSLNTEILPPMLYLKRRPD